MADPRDAHDTAPPTGRADRGAPAQTVDLGTSIVVYYADGSYEVLPKSRFAPQGGGISPTTIYTAAQDRASAAQEQAYQRERDARRDTEWQMGFDTDKSKFNMGFGEDQRQFNERLSLDRSKFGEDQRQFNTGTALDYYNKLAQTLANPRNYMESVYRLRGAPVPADSAQFSNLNQLLNFAPFLGGSAQGTQVSQAPAAQVAAQPTPQAPRVAYDDAPLPPPPAGASPNYASPYEGESGFTRDGRVRLSRNDPDAEYLLKKNPSGYSYARGGVIPEPVTGIGDWSGQPYKFGERGPEGVVPTDFLPDFLKQRSGQNGSYAVGGQIGFDGDPYGGTPYSSAPNYGMNYADPGSYDREAAALAAHRKLVLYGASPHAARTAAIDAYAAPAPAPHVPQTSTSVATDPNRAAFAQPPTTGVSQPARPVIPQPQVVQQPQPFGVTPEQQRFLDEERARTAELNRQHLLERPEVVVPPIPEVVPGGGGPPARPVQQPGFLPQNGQTAQPAQPGLPTQREVSTPGTFGNVVGNQSGGFAARPQFLPGEDQSPLQSLLAGGYLPPFLSRLFGQQEGVQSQGTNKPNRINLPKDVPLISRLGYLQMLPAERAALESYISSYGIGIEDYLAMVEQFSPQGGPSRGAPPFGNTFRPYFQG